MSGRWSKYARDLRTLPGDLRIGWRRQRWLGIWETIAPRTLFRVFRVGRLVVYAQPIDALRDVPAPAGVRIAMLRDSDWPALGDVIEARDLERFRTLLDCGHRCVVAWRGARLVGYGWVALRVGREVSHCPVPLPAHAAYLWDLFVLPEERGNGVGSALASARLRIARELGRREGWRMIAPANRASIVTLARSSGRTRIVGEIRFVKLLSRMWAQFRPVAASAS